MYSVPEEKTSVLRTVTFWATAVKLIIVKKKTDGNLRPIEYYSIIASVRGPDVLVDPQRLVCRLFTTKMDKKLRSIGAHVVSDGTTPRYRINI